MSTDKFLHEKAYRGSNLVTELAKRTIVICGAGTLGGNLLENMIRQGFGMSSPPALKVIDFDRVEAHNLNPQPYAEADVGALKVAALKNRAFRVVGAQVEAIDKRLDADNAKKFFKGASLVIDTFDNSASRKLTQDWCRAMKIACLHVGLYEDYAEVVWDEKYKVPADPQGGDICDYPLARNISLLAVVVATEEILDFCLAKKPRRKNWAITLKDLKVQEKV